MPTYDLDGSTLEIEITPDASDADQGSVTLMGRWKIKKPPVPPPPPPNPSPSIQLGATSVGFGAVEGGSNPSNQNVTVTNKGGQTLSGLSLSAVSYGSGASGWLTPTLAGTTAPTSIQLAVAVGSIPVGSYMATVNVISAVADNSPRMLTVNFVVSSPPPPPPPPPPPTQDEWTPATPADFDTAINLADYPNGTIGPIGSGLQSAINGAARGTIIRLANGSLHQANFTLPGKALNGTQGVLICSEAYYQKLIGQSSPGARGVGYRVVPATDAPYLATLRTPNTSPAVAFAPNSDVTNSYYRFEGIIFDCVKSPAYTYTAQFGIVNAEYSSDLTGGASEIDTKVPYGPIFSHCVVDGVIGHPTFFDAKYGIRLGGRNQAIVDSYIDIGKGSNGTECHAADAIRGPGPFVLDNNYLQGPGINWLSGGASLPWVVNTQGAAQTNDITCQRSYLPKLAAHKNVAGVVIKNWYESKASARNLFRGNVCDLMWGNQGQSGFPVLYQNIIGQNFDPGQYLYQQVNDTAIEYNKFLSGSSGPNNGAQIDNSIPKYGLPEAMTRTRYRHNLWYGLCQRTAQGNIQSVNQFQMLGAHKYISYEHNTMVQNHAVDDDAGVPRGINSLIVQDGQPASNGFPVGTRYRSNIVYYGQNGYVGTGTADSEYGTKAKFDPNADFSKNVVILNLGTGTSKTTPSGGATKYDLNANKYVLNEGAVLFVNQAAGNVRLQAGSPAKNYSADSDYPDAGCDMDAVDAWTQHSVDGQWGTPPPRTGGAGTPALVVFQAPADAASGIAFATQPIVLAAAGTVVTASLATAPAGVGVLAGSLTATADATGRAEFRRLRIDGGVGVVHTVTFTAQGYTEPVPAPTITPVSAPAAGDVAVTEATTYQTMLGGLLGETTGGIAMDYPYAAYQADKTAALDMAYQYGFNVLSFMWLAGVQHSTNFYQQYGPFPRDAASGWTPYLYDMKRNFEIGAPIHHDHLHQIVTEQVNPLRNMHLAAGRPFYFRLCINTYNTTGTSGDLIRPTSTFGAGGDNDGSRYAAIVLSQFQYMENIFGWVPDIVDIGNEPDLGASSVWTQTDIAKCMAATKALLNANGYYPIMAVPSCTNEANSVTWWNFVKSYNAARPGDMLTFHGYSNHPIASLNAMRTAAQAESPPAVTGMTEWGQPSNATQVARYIEECWTEADAVFYSKLSMVGIYAGGPIRVTGTGTATWVDVMRLAPQYVGWDIGGALRVAATKTPASVAKAIAFIRRDGKHVVIIRSSAAIGSLTVSGIPKGTYGITETLTSGGALLQDRGTVTVTNGGVATLTTKITGAGVVTMVRQS